MKIDFTQNDRHVAFDMTFDQQSIADNSMKFMANITGGTCEPEVVQVMTRVVREGDYVVDVGANIGFFTLILSRLVGPNGRVIAFEPGPNNLAKLRENLRANKTGNVELCVQPVWSEVKDMSFYLMRDSGTNSLAKTAETLSTIQTRTVTLDSWLKQVPQLIKIDAEGAEYEIIQGGAVALRRCPYILCELNEPSLSRFGTSQEALRIQMLNWSHETFILNQQGEMPTLVPKETKIKPRRDNTMILFSTKDAVSKAWPEVVA